MFGGVFGQSGITPEAVEAFFKGTGIVSAFLVTVFLMIRFKVIRLASVDSATEWIRVKWDVERYYRFGKRRGRLIRLKAGRHLIIRGIYSGWEVSLKEIVLPLLSITQPYKGRMLMYDRITIGYQVVAPDTKQGDASMLRCVLSVRDGNRENQVSENLDQKVVGIVLSALGKVLAQAEPDQYGLPVLLEHKMKRATAKKLKKRYGVRLVSFEPTAPTWLQGQQHYDAAELIAKAMGYETPDVQRPGEVFELPHTTSA